MRNTRVCESAEMNTGGSACKVDWGKVKGAILVEHAQTLRPSLFWYLKKITTKHLLQT